VEVKPRLVLKTALSILELVFRAIYPPKGTKEQLKYKQRRFGFMVALLILKAHELGFECVIGDAAFSCMLNKVGKPEGDLLAKTLGHRKNSNHFLCLAVDLELFFDGRYLTETSDHEPLGEYWMSLGGAWGGDFNDGNHYSLEHNGVK